MPRNERNESGLFLLLFSLLLSCQSWAQAPPDLVMDVTTDKDVYFLGEQVIISVQSCNVGSEPAEWSYLLGT